MPSLAVKHRPQAFDDLAGQSHVKIVLKELVRRVQMDEIEMPPGLMFTGPRGCGKTSSARIIAAALNCTRALPDYEESGAIGSPENEDPWPCLVCSSCQHILSQRSDAVVELDGATSGGVESIRSIAGQARLMHSGKFRVFIIDEVHAMTKEAFSALLKQLEEPPDNVVYILVTTDQHAVPATISSRCLTFQFTMLSQQDIADRMFEILMREQGFGVADPAGVQATLNFIAKRANGALRDAVMMLEQLAILGDFSLERAQATWPDTSEEFANEFLVSAQSGDFTAGMACVANAYTVVRDSGVLLDALVVKLRDMGLSASEKENGKQLGRKVAELIKTVWDYRIAVRHANTTDPSPVEALWCVFTSLLNGPVKGPLGMLAAGGGAAGAVGAVAEPVRLAGRMPAGVVAGVLLADADAGEIDLEEV